MKIVYLCEFSAGIDGVWNRVYNIAKHLAKKHEVYVFSSDIEKGSEKKAKHFEEVDGIKIFRFPVTFRLGENALFWDYENKLREIKPDVVNAHVFRHPHSTSILKAARKIGAKCFLTTHAPFVERELRSPILNLAVNVYDHFSAKKVLNSYDKVIVITKWELPFLYKLGCKREKIVYIPNGFPEEFLKERVKYSKKKVSTIIFLGRIAPIKNPEILIRAFGNILGKDYKVKLKFVGQIEKGYGSSLIDLLKQLKLDSKVEFTGPIYDLKKKIKILQESDIFVLPSKREASPQALIEAMALGMLVISSSTLGGREIIENEKNGFLFSGLEDLTEKLEYALDNYSRLKKLMTKARKDISNLTWKKLADKEVRLYAKS